MLEVKLRQVVDQELVSVNLSALAMNTRGEFRFPAAESDSADTDAGPANGMGPAVIVHCLDRHDALACLEFAARKGLLVAAANAPGDPLTWRNCDQGLAVVLPAFNARKAAMVTNLAQC